MSLYQIETDHNGQLYVKIVYADQEFRFAIESEEDACRVAEEFFNTIDDVLQEEKIPENPAHDQHNQPQPIGRDIRQVTLSNQQIEQILDEQLTTHDIAYEIHRDQKKLIYIRGDSVQEVPFESFTADDVNRVIHQVLRATS